MMEEFFLYTLFEVNEFSFKIAHVFLIMLIMALTYVMHKITKKYIITAIGEKEFHFEGTRVTLIRLVKQLLFIVSFLLTVKSLSLYNPKFDVFDLLTFELIRIKQFHVSIYHVFLILALIFGVRILINIIRLTLKRAARTSETLDHSTQYMLVQLAKYIVYTLAIVFTISSFGVDISVILTGSVGLLVGVGLGLQDFFRDLISGLILLFEGSIKVGDIVEIQAGPEEPELVAKVLKINMRTTKIETRDGNFMIVPNSKLTQEYVHNWSFGSPLTRFKITITVEYGVDTELVQKLLKEAVKSHKKVNLNKPILVRLLNFGNDGLEMDVVFWADQSWEIEIVKSEIRFKIDALFRANNITIPFPQRDVHHFYKPGQKGNRSIPPYPNPKQDQPD